MPTTSVILIALLGLLAFLQYRWLDAVSDAERTRLRAGTHERVVHFAREFDREITRVFVWLQIRSDIFHKQDWKRYAERYDEWERQASDATLVSGVYAATAREDGAFDLQMFDRSARKLVVCEWPAQLARLRVRLAESSADGRPHLTPCEETAPGQMALLSPIRAREISGKDEPAGRFPFAGVTIILLDPQAINERLLPRLASRYFSEDEQLAYRLSVVSIRDPARVLFRAPKDAAPPLTLGDVSKGLFRIRLEDITEEEWRRLTRSESQAPPDRPAHFTRFLRRGFGGFHGDDSAWRLTATHRAGSVDAIVAAARRRNLAVSFGILAVLAMAVGLIVVSAQRARRLARREIELVASVSHELRTPLSVIQSASENLADGVVRDTAQARHYGELIRDEARRLGDMVERTLAYANVAARRRSGERQLIDVGGLVQAAVDACADIRGDTQIEVVGVEGLPAVRGDREALKRALRNLIENAIKFGGDARWLRIEGEHVAKTNGGEIHLRVIDRGVGVARDERDAIFEPFERGREAVRRRIPGSGLGLSIVRRIVEAHGGRVMLKSAAGQGSVFVITLPCDGARGGEKA